MRVARAPHAIYIRHTGKRASNFMPRVAFTRASFPASCLPCSFPCSSSSFSAATTTHTISSSPSSPRVHQFVSFRAHSKKNVAKEFGSQFATPNYAGGRNTRSRFTVHLSAEQLPSDKFQISRLNERAPFHARKKAAHYSDSCNFKREIRGHTPSDPITACASCKREKQMRKKESKARKGKKEGEREIEREREKKKDIPINYISRRIVTE